MGLLYLSLESGFLCFTALPDGFVLICVLLRYLPSQKSGERTEMMNMMTGAVGNNGGVGVWRFASR